MHEESIEKKGSQDGALDMDPAYISCFEMAMLDYEALTVEVEGKGMRLKSDKCYRRIERGGGWDAQWIMSNYALVCCKMSTLPRAIRDFVEYIGDNAAALWMNSTEEAQRRILKPSKEG